MTSIAARVDAAGAARNVVDGFQDWLSALTVVDWILLAAIAAALYWLVSSIRSTTRIGPVEVDKLDADSDKDYVPPINELTSYLRERLSTSGLAPPPAVPSGSPQADVLAAVEASPIPQAKWIAALLRFMPSPPAPPRYKLSGTLLGDEPVPPVALPLGGGGPCGLRFWLRPDREGRELLATTNGEWSHRQAVERVAARIYMAVAEESVHVVPPWARWSDVDAFLQYADGLEALADERLATARRCFQEAADAEPGNLLARLQLANLDERWAAALDGAGGLQYVFKAAMVKPAAARALGQAFALCAYLGLAEDRPDLVLARYRASVLASMLATAVEDVVSGADPSPLAGDLVAVVVGLDMDDVAGQLRRLAREQGDAAQSLLRPWYTLLAQGRLRHRYEPTGRERRGLRCTIAVSRHCLAVREIGLDTSRRAGLRLWWHTFAVRYLRLGLGRASAGWQAHYNAACLYALRFTREQELAAATAAAPAPAGAAAA